MRRPTFIQSLIRSEPVRVAQLAAGAALALAGLAMVIVLPIPGVGILTFGVGLILVLRNSGWARRRYVRWKRRYPRAGKLTEFGLQRHKTPAEVLHLKRRRETAPPVEAQPEPSAGQS